MKALADDETFPELPCQVICIRGNEELTIGAEYLVVGHRKDLGSGLRILLVKDTNFNYVGEFNCHRFALSPRYSEAEAAVVVKSEAIPDWKLLRDSNVDPNHCACGIPRQSCIYHAEVSP